MRWNNICQLQSYTDGWFKILMKLKCILEALIFVILALSLTILTKMTLGSITNGLQVIYFRNYL